MKKITLLVASVLLLSTVTFAQSEKAKELKKSKQEFNPSLSEEQKSQAMQLRSSAKKIKTSTLSEAEQVEHKKQLKTDCQAFKQSLTPKQKRKSKELRAKKKELSCSLTLEQKVALKKE